jgi:PAS domain S-box-containing protein
MEEVNNPILNSVIVGYAHHKIVFDEEGKPIDYMFLDVNSAFESITGLKKDGLINRSGLKIWPTLDNSSFNWIEHYGKIALEGGESVFEQYSETLAKWFRVHVFSTEKMFFTSLFVDITHEHAQRDELKQLKGLKNTAKLKVQESKKSSSNETTNDGNGLMVGYADVKFLLYRVLPAFSLILVLLIGVAFWLMLLAHESRINAVNNRIKLSALVDFKQLRDEQTKAIEALQLSLLNDFRIIEAMRNGNSDKLYELLAPLFESLKEQYGITHFYFSDSDRICILRVHKPEMHGDKIDRYTTVQAEQSQRVVSGIEFGRLGKFTLRVVAPVYEYGELLGYIELGKAVEDILYEMAKNEGVEKLLVVDKKFLDRAKWENRTGEIERKFDWDFLPNQAVIFSSMEVLHANPQLANALLDVSSQTSTKLNLNNRYWSVMSTNISDASNNEVGRLFLFLDVTDFKLEQHKLVVLWAVIAAGLLIILLLVVFVVVKKAYSGIRSTLKKLAQSEAHFRFLVTYSYDLIFKLNPAGIFTYVSPSWKMALGYDPLYMQGKDINQLLSSEDYILCLDYMERVAAAKKSLPAIQYRVKHENGSWRWHEGNVTPVFDTNDMLLSFIGVSRDINDRKLNEHKLKTAFKESERTNKLMSGRENRILELKIEVNQLARKLNMGVIYKSVEK